MSVIIRCGTPDCDWGHRVSELGEEQLNLCYSEFRKHCMQRHDLEEWKYQRRTCTSTWSTGCSRSLKVRNHFGCRLRHSSRQMVKKDLPRRCSYKRLTATAQPCHIVKSSCFTPLA